MWRGSRRGGIDSMGLAVELIAWVSRWTGRRRGSRGGGGDGVDLAGEELTAWVSRWS